MRVNFYYRNRGPGNYSIETVFSTVRKRLGARINAITLRTRKPIDLGAIFRLWKVEADIHHITGAVNYVSFALPRERTIVTVHDVGHYTNTLKGFRRAIYKYLFWIFPLARAARITAISDFTKEQLVKLFAIPPGKIVVIPNPVNPLFKLMPAPTNAVPVVLQIGSGRNKNINVLIEAVQGLNVKLLLIRQPTDSLIAQLQRAGLNYEFRHDLSELELLACYAASDIVFFASTYEGFGLPILEGMAVGRPVITSRISPMREIGNDGVLLVDPLKPCEVRGAIQSLIRDSALRERLVQRGQEIVRLYSDEEVANQYYSLYCDVLRSNKR